MVQYSFNGSSKMVRNSTSGTFHFFLKKPLFSFKAFVRKDLNKKRFFLLLVISIVWGYISLKIIKNNQINFTNFSENYLHLSISKRTEKILEYMPKPLSPKFVKA